jgi:dTDP-4-dehydrorhamnose reductase
MSKLLGEREVMAANPDALVLRTMIFGRATPDRRPKLAEKINSALGAGLPMTLWDDLTFCPLYARDAADMILRLSATNSRGILNLGCAEVVTQADFGRAMAETGGFDGANLVGELRDAAENLTVDVSHAEALIGPMPCLYESLNRYWARG